MKKTMIRILAGVSIVLLLLSMFLFVRVMAFSTILKYLDQDIIINILGDNSGNVDIDIITDNGIQQSREEITKDLMESIIGLLITTPVTAVTIKLTLTGKQTLEKE